MATTKILAHKRTIQALLCWAALIGAGNIRALEPAGPALYALPGEWSCISWWLVAPVPNDTPADKAPEHFREGEPIFAGASERWNLQVSPFSFVDLKSECGRSRRIWAAVRIDSQTGGPRELRVESYYKVRVFQNGRLVLNKIQIPAPTARIELPKGQCELAVEITPNAGRCRFSLLLTAPGASQAVDGDKLVVPTAAGKEPDSAASALAAITFAPVEALLQPRQQTTLVAGFAGSLPCGLDPLTIRLSNPDGSELSPQMPARTAVELFRTPWRTTYTLPESGELKYQLKAEIRGAGKLLGAKEAALYSLPAFKLAAANLEADISKRAGVSTHPLIYAPLAVEKLKLLLEKLESGREKNTQLAGAAMMDLVSTAQTSVTAEEAGKDPAQGRTGFFERAYLSRIDGQPQPYFMFVPPGYTQRKAAELFPLIVFLHGYVPTFDKQRWWEGLPELNDVLAGQNAIMAVPFARTNTDFQGCGEIDVLDVIAEVKRHYAIDKTRVYLYGISMGGMGVYTLGAHYPDLFAAGVAVCARADSPLLNGRPLAEFQPFKQWLIQADNPISLCENFLNLPLQIYHFSDDQIISASEAQRMEKRFKELGCDAELHLAPGDHSNGYEVISAEEPVKWLLQHKLNPAPSKGRLKSYSLRYAAQDEVRVTAATGDLKPLELEWNIEAGRYKFKQQSGNIVQRQIQGALHPPKLEGALRKTPQLCGPIREATCGPFILVYGTSGSEEANARNKANAERMAKEWHGFTGSRAAIKADNEVTEEEKQHNHLFLFGEEQENELHEEAAAGGRLPFIVKDGEAVIGIRKVSLAGKGLMYLFPCPLADAREPRSVVICTGIPYGQDVAINHKFDLLPDFLVYAPQRAEDSTGANQPVCAGFFDGLWHLNEQTTWWFDK
jgi:pimeloyl-ACP methyl ester carboxylesterase